MNSQGNTPLAQRRVLARRVIIGGAVVLCVLLLTIYGRETNSGPLHGVQNAAGTVVTPLEDGVSRAVQPVRNAWDWADGLANARDRAARLSKEVQTLKGELIQEQFENEELPKIAGLAGLGDEWNRDYTQRPADIIARSASPYYTDARIDVGTDQGVVVNSPVIAQGGAGPALVGVVTQAGPISSTVAFLSDSQTSIGVTITNAESAIGLLEPTVPGAYAITGIPIGVPVANGDVVYTAGFSEAGDLSVYPRGIPIGVVTGVGHRETDVDQTVQMSPFVDTDSLAYVVALAPKSALARQRAATP